MASVSSIGVGSGVLTSDLIDQLASAEREPTEKRLDAKQETVEAKLSDISRLKNAVTDLRLSARFLSSASFLSATSATSSSSAITATADSGAKLGTYQIDVTNLATAQTLNSTTFTDDDTTSVGTGTLSISVAGVTKNITIDSSNSTLQGIADEINSQSGLGATATVIYTGSGYQLSISADETGTDNSIEINVTDDDGNDTDTSGLSQLVFNGTTQNLSEDIAAEDLTFTLNGISITRSSNTVDDVLSGITFDFTAETSGSLATVKVQQDSSAIAEKIQGLVDDYNALQEIISETTDYDVDSGVAGTLLGEASVRNVSSLLRNIIYSVVPGLESGGVRSLAEIGISTDKDSGQLSFDSSIFSKKMADYPDDVAALFANQGRTSDSQVEFLTSSINTKVGTYDINITQAATQGELTGSLALSGSTVVDADNDEFAIKVDGVQSGTITLTQNTYTDSELVDEIQSQLNADSALSAAGVSVVVSLDGSNQLVFTSTSYGSSSTVEVTSNDTNSSSTLGIDVATGTDGVDVAGTINGEAATGSGQKLSANEGSDAYGIVVKVGGSATGDRGSVTYIEGVAQQLVDTVTGFIGVDGILTSTESRLNSELESIGEERTKLEDRISALVDRLASQFTAADILISQLESTKSFISAQLEALASSSSSKS
ncbi:flagellar capping protein [Hahella sp. CCB-MM4]|uniref:flagellar filament capping protein FliD n=1 Tax=Hahella sp. (strain CCB-MM4) TaxID=1926491 RepID=UPI000B9BD6CC|nr:flagellar filament capping protein FliD [Hahella sp. CCB-MM4]OZG73771.1 flagellar capping protein [Hahella sp. CCB-MM4]